MRNYFIGEVFKSLLIVICENCEVAGQIGLIKRFMIESFPKTKQQRPANYFPLSLLG